MHALPAVNVLLLVTSDRMFASPPLHGHLLSLFLSTPQTKSAIRHGFVSCLEAEEEMVEGWFYKACYCYDQKTTGWFSVKKLYYTIKWCFLCVIFREWRRWHGSHKWRPPAHCYQHEKEYLPVPPSNSTSGCTQRGSLPFRVRSQPRNPQDCFWTTRFDYFLAGFEAASIM